MVDYRRYRSILLHEEGVIEMARDVDELFPPEMPHERIKRLDKSGVFFSKRKKEWRATSYLTGNIFKTPFKTKAAAKKKAKSSRKKKKKKW